MALAGNSVFLTDVFGTIYFHNEVNANNIISRITLDSYGTLNSIGILNSVGPILDSSGSSGTSGQILSSISSGVQWISPSTNFTLTTASTQQFTCFNSIWNNYNITLSLKATSSVIPVKIQIGTSSLATSTDWNYNYSNAFCPYDNGTYNATVAKNVYSGRGNIHPLYLGSTTGSSVVYSVFEFTIYNPFNSILSTFIKSNNQWYSGNNGGNYIVNGYLNAAAGANSFDTLYLYFGSAIDGGTLSVRGFN